MSWPTSTLEGMALFEGDGKAWLHAFCMAINERQAVLNLTKTQWYLADETEAADPVLSDFDGIRIHGPDSPVRNNFERIITAIKSMIDAEYFTVASGYGDFWTVATLEADIGLGEFPTGDYQFAELALWARIQGALDRMIYAAKLVTGSGSSARSYPDEYAGGFGGSPALAWGDLVTSPGPILLGTFTESWRVGWRVQTYGFSYGAFELRQAPDVGKSLGGAGLTGTITGIAYLTTHLRSNYEGGNFWVSIGGSASTEIDISDLSAKYIVGDPSDLTFGDPTGALMTLDTSTPATYPFDPMVSSGYCYLFVTGVRFFYDIAGELTDQA